MFKIQTETYSELTCIGGFDCELTLNSSRHVKLFCSESAADMLQVLILQYAVIHYIDLSYHTRLVKLSENGASLKFRRVLKCTLLTHVEGYPLRLFYF